MDIPANHQELTPLGRLRARLREIARRTKPVPVATHAVTALDFLQKKSSNPAPTEARSSGKVGAYVPPARTKVALTTPAETSGVATLAPLTAIAQQYLGETELRRIRDAYRLSDSAHLGQFRNSGEPYISHPIAVAQICAGWKLDADALMAALLHDVMEDSDVRKQELF